MNSSGFKGLDDRKSTSWNDLQKELNAIKKDINIITEMEVSEPSKTPILVELDKQLNEIKEKMHDYIDTL